jgi:DNA mismatch endonuclease (patch repair protein)
MQGNTRRDTRPELLLRHELHAMGLRYRVDARPLLDLNRRADLVFRPAKVAVFVHGCFWHGCSEHYYAPATNVDYWSAKVDRNVRRDADTDTRLTAEGWRVMVVWEHEDPHKAALRVARIVRARRARLGRRASTTSR